MPNVKPGDLAKIVYDPTFPTNVGAQFLVKEEFKIPKGRQFALDGQFLKPQLAWILIALQPVRGFIHGTGGAGTVWPGREFVAFDAWLRRIDPPTDGEKLWSRDKLPREEMIERCAMMDKFVKEVLK